MRQTPTRMAISMKGNIPLNNPNPLPLSISTLWFLLLSMPWLNCFGLQTMDAAPSITCPIAPSPRLKNLRSCPILSPSLKWRWQLPLLLPWTIVAAATLTWLPLHCHHPLPRWTWLPTNHASSKCQGKMISLMFSSCGWKDVTVHFWFFICQGLLHSWSHWNVELVMRKSSMDHSENQTVK